MAAGRVDFDARRVTNIAPMTIPEGSRQAGEAVTKQPPAGQEAEGGPVAARAQPPTGRSARANRRSQTARSLMLGNTRNLKFGVWAEVSVREDILDECALLYARAHSWIDPIRDGPLIEATARISVRLRKLDLLLDASVADWAVRAEPRPNAAGLTALAARLEAQLARNLEALGLSPRAAASLGLVKLHAAERIRMATEARLARYAQPGLSRPETAALPAGVAEGREP
jgi:hypothetical protein